MRHTIYFIALISFQLPAQPAIQWQKSLGGTYFDEGQYIEQTRDNGYIVLALAISNNGDVTGNHGGRDFWLLKFNETGELLWKKTYGGSNNDYPFAVQQTTDGGYILAGNTESNNWNVSGNHGARDAWIIKTDSLGNIEWKRCYGGSQYEDAHAIRQTRDGGYIFVGFAGSDDGDVSGVFGDWDYWVVKLAANGDIQWQQAFGGSSLDIANDVIQTTDNGFVITGGAYSEDGDVVGSHGSSDYWVIKLREDGSLEWKKAFGGNSEDVCEEIVQTPDGGYAMVGYALKNTEGQITGHHGGFYDYWVAKISSEGELQWQRALGGSNLDYGRSICLAPDGGLVVAGESMSLEGDIQSDNHGENDMWIVKLDDQGQKVWQKSIGGSLSDLGYTIRSTPDGGYVATGFNWSTDGDATDCKGYNDVWVVKLAPESSPVVQPGQSASFKIFPNPVSEYLNIEINDETSILHAYVYNALGMLVLETTVAPHKLLYTGSLPHGWYAVTIKDDQQAWSGKILKL